MGQPITPSQTVGPFFGFALPRDGGHQLVPTGARAALRIEGQVLDGAGEPVPDALIEIWQADSSGTYRKDRGFTGFGRSRTDPEGLFRFVTVKPGATPAPGGGTQAPHVNVTVLTRGLLRHLTTRMYFPDETRANAKDPVLNLVDPTRRGTLLAHDDAGILRFDIRLQGEQETVFFAI